MNLIDFMPSKITISQSAVIAVLLFLVAGATAAVSAASLPLDIRFETPLSRSDPASHQIGGLRSIVQDDLGFIWFGGETGLGRFDGKRLVHYQANPLIKNTLPASYIRHLLVDHEGVLWVATEGGLARYRVETDSFVPVTSVGGTAFAVEAASALAVDKDNRLYVGTRLGLYVINPTRTAMELFVPQPPLPKPSVEQILGLSLDAQQRVWIATAGIGVAIFDPATKRFEYLLHDPQNPNSLLSNSTNSILLDDQGRAWIGTLGAGVSLFDPKAGDFKNFVPGKGEFPLKGGVVASIIQDREGVVWIALDQGGLAYFDEDKQGFRHFLHEPSNSTSVISNQLRVVYEDKNSDLWIGAYPSGVSFYNRSKRPFRSYRARPDDPAGLSHDAILRFKEASDGTVWIGTEGGLNAFDRHTDRFRRYLSDPDDPGALNANPVLAIEEDIDGQLWIGTWSGGLHRFDPETDTFTRYLPDPNDPGSINSAFIWSIIRDSDDTIWIATETGGISRYNRETDNFTSFVHHPDDSTSISGNFVFAMLETTDKKLWIGTYNGLNIFDKQTGTFARFPYEIGEQGATTSKFIKCLYEDSRGLIWIGTNHGGVNIFDPGTGLFTYLDIAQGLPSSSIASIIEDNSGDLWLTTANGMAKVHYPSLSVTVFSESDGLAGSHFQRDASIKDAEGQLYFGGTEGITVFHPEDLQVSQGNFPVRITHFRIFNQDVPIATKTSPLRKAILLTDELRLSHRDTMFAFDFAAVTFRNAGGIHYSYMLEGFDRNWHDIGKHPTATYTNIAPGRYTFKVRASATRDTWVEGQSITITIVPPLWRRWWAYCLYAVVILALLYYRREFVRLRRRAETYKNKSITDPLTGLYNRLGIGQIAEGIFANTETRKGYCLMLLDIDHFKRVNDQRGHDVGDRILISVADVIRQCIRNSDYLGRWGGEEFIVICATDTAKNGSLLAEKIRAAVDAHVCEAEVAPLQVTISVGVTDIKPEDSFPAAIKRADLSLYKAKAMGRNCVVLADEVNSNIAKKDSCD